MVRILKFDLRSWQLLTWIIFPPTVLVLVPSVLMGRWNDAIVYSLQHVLLFLFACVWINARKLYWFILVLLIMTACLGVGVWISSASVWQHSEKSTFTELLGGGLDTVEGSGTRRWTIPKEIEEFELTFESRALRKTNEESWIASQPEIAIRSESEDGILFSRIITPEGDDPYVMRYFDLNMPTANHTFKVVLEMRAPQNVAQVGCRGVWLQVWHQGGGAGCKSVSLSPDWQTYSNTWQAPAGAKSEIIRVILNDFDGITYDVRNIRLFVACKEGWCRLAPLIPETPYLMVSGDRAGLEPAHIVGIRVDSDWQKIEIAFPSSKLAEPATILAAEIVTGGGAKVQTKNVVLTVDGVQARALRSNARQSYYFSHPNLAGHSLAVIGLVLLSVTRSTNAGVLISLLVLLTVFFTGSRGAWIAVLLGILAHFGLILLNRVRLRAILPLTLIATIAILKAEESLGRLGVLSIQTGGQGHRLQIWAAYAQLFWNNFLTGVGGSSRALTLAWSRLNAEALPETPQHAHNLWLQFGTSFGVLGIIAVLWLTVGLTYLAWSRGRWQGIILIAPVFIMNIFDYTFFYSGVYIPLLLGLNAINLRTVNQTVTEHPALAFSARFVKKA